MASITFDTHQFVKDLQARGFSADQAEGINDALKNVLVVAEVATKQDIRTMEQALKELEYRLTIKLGTVVAGAIAIVAALVKML